ncbi:hypothetical protein VNO78_08749 [Psophocarpus tetragonolobus]|uniref:Uncharacterized protein n=1 Tax=Psophocarpus tetragonolobus TaxID=3891 RepID=A0AAN9XU14_PSOTE
MHLSGRACKLCSFLHFEMIILNLQFAHFRCQGSVKGVFAAPPEYHPTPHSRNVKLEEKAYRELYTQ